MAIDTYVIGNDGNVTLPNADAVFKVRSFAANLSRPSSDLTAFGDTGKRRRVGLLDLTGSLNAVIGVNAAGSAGTTSTSIMFSQTATAALTLTVFDTTNGTSDAKIVANCVFNSFAFNSDKNGDATLTANFENADGVAPVVTWLI
jgi:hypothetical protein